eukprot:136511-Prymnesium_polylepis.1
MSPSSERSVLKMSRAAARPCHIRQVGARAMLGREACHIRQVATPCRRAHTHAPRDASARQASARQASARQAKSSYGQSTSNCHRVGAAARSTAPRGLEAQARRLILWGGWPATHLQSLREFERP